MKIMTWSDPEIVRQARAHQLTLANLEAFMKTHAPFVEQEVEGEIVGEEAGKRLAKIVVAMEPAGATHYAMWFQEGKKVVWKFFVAGDPWIGVCTNCEFPPEELERMAADSRNWAVNTSRGAKRADVDTRKPLLRRPGPPG